MRLWPVTLGAVLAALPGTLALQTVANAATVAPSLTSISPSSGPAYGGTLVTLSGNNLLGASQVLFGNTPGTVRSDSPTSITVVAPALPIPQNVPVKVVTASGTSNSEQFFPYPTACAGPCPLPPVVTSLIIPASKSSVTLLGRSLKFASLVDFGQTAAVILSDSANSITVLPPTGLSGPIQVTVTTPYGTSSPVSYTRSAPPASRTRTTPSPGPDMSHRRTPNQMSDVSHTTVANPQMHALIHEHWMDGKKKPSHEHWMDGKKKRRP